MTQGLEVKRQCVGWNAQALRKLARRKAFRAGLNEKPVDLQTTALSKSSQRLYGGIRFHDSRIIELIRCVKLSRLTLYPPFTQ